MLYLDSSLFTLTKHPCKYLNKKTGRCKIYNKRKEVNPNCLTLEEMYIIGSFPKDCPYVKNDIEYQNRKDTRQEIINFPDLLEEYKKSNNESHSVIGIYDTLRDNICSQCQSCNLIEKWDDKFSIIFFRYECEVCHNKWNTLNKQIKFTIKLIKKRF
jgi:uncharacterized cysteine cluster protein YcgN (CxxCxxCC family)